MAHFAHQACLLRGAIRSYDWGSTTALAELLGEPAPSPEPQAELWLGAHPLASAQVRLDGRWVSLDDAIERAPEAILGGPPDGPPAGRLPFLLKVLAVARPLSIQAHPDRAQARAGFARENARGVPLDAPQRCYRDESDKPELVCALTPCWVLRGFRPPDEIRARLAELGAESLVPDAGDEAEWLRKFLEGWLRAPRSSRERLLGRAEQAARARRSDPVFDWVARLAEAHSGDPAALAPAFLHLLRLEPGQATFLEARVLHSYLEGTAVEIMATSDNVLRGGLTRKRVDLDELLGVLRFRSGAPEILEAEPVGPGECSYRTPVSDFELSVLTPGPGVPVVAGRSGRVEVLLCTAGRARLVGVRSGDLALDRGQGALLPAAAGAVRVEGPATLYRASVPSRRTRVEATPGR